MNEWPKENKLLRRAMLAVIAAVCTMGAMTACRTTEGLGDDMEELGDDISDEARDANDD